MCMFQSSFWKQNVFLGVKSSSGKGSESPSPGLAGPPPACALQPGPSSFSSPSRVIQDLGSVPSPVRTPPFLSSSVAPLKGARRPSTQKLKLYSPWTRTPCPPAAPESPLLLSLEASCSDPQSSLAWSPLRLVYLVWLLPLSIMFWSFML